MLNDFRKLIQSHLNRISDLDAGEVVGDDMIEEGKYYLGYRLRTTGVRANLDYSNMKKKIIFMGYLSTKESSLSKLDDFTDSIVDELEKLRFVCNTEDISVLGSGVRKVYINGTTNYDYLDGLLK